MATITDVVTKLVEQTNGGQQSWYACRDATGEDVWTGPCGLYQFVVRGSLLYFLWPMPGGFNKVYCIGSEIWSAPLITLLKEKYPVEVGWPGIEEDIRDQDDLRPKDWPTAADAIDVAFEVLG